MCRVVRLLALQGVLAGLPLPAAGLEANFPLVDDRAPEFPHALGLEEAKRLAVQRNWDLLAARANVDQAVAQRIIALEFPNPTGSVNTSKANLDRTNRAGAGSGLWDKSYDTVFAVNQLLEIGKRSIRQASAAAGLSAAEASFQDARRTLELGVAKAYIAALLGQANVRILHQTAESLQKEAKIADTRLQAGDVSKADKAQIEIAALRSDLDAEASQSNAVMARIAVETLLGARHPTGRWQLATSLEDLAGSETHGSSQAEARPDLVAAQASLRKAGEDLRLQRALRIPDPTVQLQYEHQPPDQPNTVGFGFSLPLPIWNLNGGNIHAAAAARDAAEAQLGKVRTQVAADIANAEVAFAEAGHRWKRYATEIQPRSAEVLKTITYAYRKGGASLLDLLSAERNDNDIRVATAQAMADRATAAATLANVKYLAASPSEKMPYPKIPHGSKIP